MCNVKPNFLCDVCVPKKKFKTSQRLILHNKYVHSNKAQKLKCKICYKIFGSKQTLKKYTQRHYEEEEKLRKEKETAEVPTSKKKKRRVRFKIHSTKSAPAKLLK